jgi:hypothetical protein
MTRPNISSWVVSLLVVAAMLAVTQTALAEDNPFGPIRVGANRGSYNGKCPVEIIYTGNINLNTPHAKGFVFNYSWGRSDGAKGPVTVVTPSSAQRMLIVRDHWRLGAAGQHYEVSETLFVNSGNTHLQQSSQVISVTCR